jgi:hypothetical protein
VTTRATATRPAPEILARAAAGHHPSGLAVDGQHLYFTVRDTGELRRVPKTGGEVSSLAVAQKGASELLCRAGWLYWWNAWGNELVRMPAAGGPREVLAAEARFDLPLAADDAHLYWVRTPGRRSQIVRTPLSGGAPEVIAERQTNVSSLALDDEHVYWTTLGTRAKEYADGGVARAAKGGGEAELISSPETSARAVARAGKEIYFAAFGPVSERARGGAIRRRPARGGDITTLAGGLRGPSDIAVDSRYVYWLDYFRAELWRVPRAGGAPEQLASGARGEVGYALAADERALYWIQGAFLTQGGWSVVRLPKPR